MRRNRSQLEELLIASHIVPWRDADDSERLDVDNGILLSPNYDALFDRHLISFNDDGQIMLSESVPKDLTASLSISGKEKIKVFEDESVFAEAQSESSMIKVVLAFLYDSHGKVLLAQRPAGKFYGGLWEFQVAKLKAMKPSNKPP